MRCAIAFAKGLSFGASGYLALRRFSSSCSSTLRRRPLNINLSIRARSRPSGLWRYAARRAVKSASSSSSAPFSSPPPQEGGDNRLQFNW
jgi:hypothetical protein